MRAVRITKGHPRLWITPAELDDFRRKSLGFRRPWRDRVLAMLEEALTDPLAWADQAHRKGNLQDFALALGQAWHLTGQRRFGLAAERLWENFEPFASQTGSYDCWGEVAESAATLYDWLHDYWRRRGLLRDVARLVLFCGRRALDELLHLHILDDWHNYALGLQSGVLATALAIGHDYPELEDGRLIETMRQLHFTGYRCEGLWVQDFHRVGPMVRCLDAALRADGGAGFCCTWEAAGGYQRVDGWELVKMACLWSAGAPSVAGRVVWPELRLAGEALLEVFRPDGRTLVWGDGLPSAFTTKMANTLCHLHARTPHPDFAACLRAWGGLELGRVPVHHLLAGSPDALPRRRRRAPARPFGRGGFRPAALPSSANLGALVVMRSGWDEDATLVTFRCGRHGGWHNHLDHNGFTIYRGGPLALDSGGAGYRGHHRAEYASRTIAHNCILVRDDRRRHWVGRYGLPVSNDGGQRIVTISHRPPNDRSGDPHAPLTAERLERLRDEFDMGTLLAFEPGEAFDYVAGDATRAYTYPWSGLGENPSRRVEEAVRQLVFLKPEWIVIFDRVEATRAEFAKRWLLHTAGPPAYFVAGRKRTPRAGIRRLPAAGPFEFASLGGRLTVWPLLPEPRKVRAVGGKGYECWVDRMPDGKGRNFPSPHPAVEVGAWRLEVSPARAARRDCFLTVLHAGLRKERPVRSKVRFDVRRTRSAVELTILTLPGLRRSRTSRTETSPLARLCFSVSGAVRAELAWAGREAVWTAPAPARVPRA